MECPHLELIKRTNNPFIREGLALPQMECSVCRSKKHTCMCLVCGILLCGRYVKGHAVEHYAQMHKHILSIDCNALSVFCYLCNSVVNNEKCYKYYRKLRRILQGKLDSQKIPSSFTPKQCESENNLNVSRKSNTKKIQCKVKVSGLVNLGNSCFMSAVLQALCNIDVFSYYFIKLPSSENTIPLRNALSKSSNSEEVSIAEELRKTIILLLEGNKSVISPQSLLTVIHRVVPRFRGYHQQDAHEFLRYMLDRLHMELEALNNSSANKSNVRALNATIVTSIFGGILQNEVKCLICGTESRKLDPFFDLSLDIPQKCDQDEITENCLLTECLTKFTELEELDDSELFHCPNCKCKQKSTKKFLIRRLPNVLCLHLKRFKWTKGSRGKLETHISFPCKDLDMSNFILNNRHETRNSSGGSLYDLAAIIVHHGNGISGHYTAYATHDGCWHHFNDSSVTVCTEETVLQSKAYILFYVRR